MRAPKPLANEAACPAGHACADRRLWHSASGQCRALTYPETITGAISKAFIRLVDPKSKGVRRRIQIPSSAEFCRGVRLTVRAEAITLEIRLRV